VGATVKTFLVDFVRLARPEQYVKNLFIFLPLFFAYKLTDVSRFLACLLSFVAFCLLASAVYVLNDIRDISSDCLHPNKRNRPLASGRISPKQGKWFGLMLILMSMSFWYFIKMPAVLIFIVYFTLNCFYSLWLKHIAVVDVTCIAIGFVLRVLIGTVQADLSTSHWIILMTFLLSMFLALAKRRDDLILQEMNNQKLRKSMDGYNLEFVSLSMLLMAAVTVVSYILYTVSPDVVSRYNNEYIYLTTFWVILGIMRYFQITFVQKISGSPTLVLWKDTFIKIVLLGWVLTYFIIMYL